VLNPGKDVASTLNICKRQWVFLVRTGRGRHAPYHAKQRMMRERFHEKGFAARFEQTMDLAVGAAQVEVV
jgi:hypothetical protein